MESCLKFLGEWDQLEQWTKGLLIDISKKKQKDSSKYVPEGVEGLIKYKGDVSKIIFKLIGGLKSSMGYLGSKNVINLRNKPKFVKITKAGFYESMVHSIDEVKKNSQYLWGIYINFF